MRSAASGIKKIAERLQLSWDQVRREFMDINQIEALIKQGESLCLEFKTSTSQLKAALETICAYLNGKGGVVLIGVKNNGQIIGQDVTDNTRQEIAREIKKIEPAPQIDVNYTATSNGKVVIVVESSFGRHAPYVYDGRPYERVESSTGLMSQHRYEQLLVRRKQLNHAWDEQPSKNHDIDSLDHDEIRRTISDGINHNRIGAEVQSYDIKHILSKLKLLKNSVPTNAAVVLFSKDVEQDYSNCMIRLARFRGTNNIGDFIDNQRVHGNAFRLIQAAHDFAQRHLPIASFFTSDKMQRTDQPAVPALALREALINAISHRDYHNRSATVALAIYDDRLELWNNGILPPELKVDDLRKPHQSYPRNEDIATIFYKRGWVEGWGTGTLRMIGYCQKNGTPEPEFQEYSSGFAVVFRFNEPMNTAAKDSVHKLTPRQNEILKILSAGDRMSVSEISAHLTDAPAPRTLRDDLARLKEMGLIELTGRARTAKWFLVKK